MTWKGQSIGGHIDVGSWSLAPSEPNPIDTFRWARVNNRKKRHLWLGGGTACGITKWHTIDTDAPEDACKVCMAYARGWLDRHTLGANPPLHVSPIGADTRLPKAAE